MVIAGNGPISLTVQRRRDAFINLVHGRKTAVRARLVPSRAPRAQCSRKVIARAERIKFPLCIRAAVAAAAAEIGLLAIRQALSVCKRIYVWLGN